MRADRLINILLLLQQKRKMHVCDLARELNVSARTIYRDLVVLSSNGFPVYAEKGPGGGCCIVEEYRSSFSRITPVELDALRAINLPETLLSMEAGKTLQRALLKLNAARSGELQQETFLHLDWNPWRRDDKTPLDVLNIFYEAARKHCLVRVKYFLWNRAEIDQVIEPYGIVAKTGEWYVVYSVNGNLRFQKARTFTLVEMLNLTFKREEGFNLEEVWKRITARSFNEQDAYRVRIKATPAAVEIIKGTYWDSPYKVLSYSSALEPDGTLIMDLQFDYLPSARTFLLGMGGSVEVLEPEPLRWSLADFARQVLNIYSV